MAPLVSLPEPVSLYAGLVVRLLWGLEVGMWAWVPSEASETFAKPDCTSPYSKEALLHKNLVTVWIQAPRGKMVEAVTQTTS